MTFFFLPRRKKRRKIGSTFNKRLKIKKRRAIKVKLKKSSGCSILINVLKRNKRKKRRIIGEEGKKNGDETSGIRYEINHSGWPISKIGIEPS